MTAPQRQLELLLRLSQLAKERGDRVALLLLEIRLRRLA